MKRSRFWRWLALAITGITLFAIFLVISLPAEYAARIVNALNDDVMLQQAAGSAWNGSATLTAKRNAKPLGRIQWKIHPWKIFTGTLATDVDFSGSGIDARGTVEAGLRRYRLLHVKATAPATALVQLYPAIGLVGVSGQLLFSADTLELDANEIRGSGDLTWANAASRMLPIEKIGTYRLTLTGQGDHIAMLLSTVEGAIQAAGNGEWRLFTDGMFRFNGTLSSTSPQPTIDLLLNAVGPAQADGAHRFSFETRLMVIKNKTN